MTFWRTFPGVCSREVFITQTQVNSVWQAEPHQLRAILEGLVEGLVTFDLDGNIISLNASARRLHGIKEAVGSPKVAELAAYQYLDGSAVGENDTPAARVLRGETFTAYELWTHTASGVNTDINRDTGKGANGKSGRTHEGRWLGAYKRDSSSGLGYAWGTDRT